MTRDEIDVLRALAISSLDYDPETGVLRWKVARAQRVRVGDIAGSLNRYSGYQTVSLRNKGYRAHRLIWLMVHGEWPDLVIDHIDRDTANNRLSNLRLATRSQNSANGKVRRNGLKGAHFHKGSRRWHAKLCGKLVGSFGTEDEAHRAYVQAASLKHGPFACAG